MADDDDDAVVEAPFCVVCRRSSAVKWRKHAFSRGHQQAAQQFLLSQATWLQELSATTEWWRCVFCDASGAAAADAVAHFGVEQHKKRVEEFCRHHRCDADRQTRPQLWLTADRRRELEKALNKREDADEQLQESQQEEGDEAASDRVEAFLSSAASRIQEVRAERRVVDEAPVVTRKQQQEELLGPQLTLVTDSRRCKTVTSADGVLQNPLGRHEGKRVWGGGIVKLRKAEWIPWTIDQLVKDEQAEHPETQNYGTESAAFSHRVTELARAEGLSSIASVSWGASVGNVHTSAVPPWMVQSEEEYKKYNRRDAPPQSATTANNKSVEKRRDIFSELQSKANYSPDWLPNFGGVWQEGPRSKTKQTFRRAAATAKPPRARSPPRLVSVCAVKPLVQPPAQRVETVKAPLQPSSATPPLPPQRPAKLPASVELPSHSPRETPALPSSRAATGSATTQGKTTTPLDAKKQMLFAQKERLRAKMAARRRQ